MPVLAGDVLADPVHVRHHLVQAADRQAATEFRGLANAALPASSSDSFSLPNASTGMNTSPLTSSTAGCPVPDRRPGSRRWSGCSA